MQYVFVPMMLAVAGFLMACAWIAHLKFKTWGFWPALALSWLFVLPEYVLNVFSARWGREVFSGAQMAAIHLVAGVICVALVSRFYLGESLSGTQLLGFALMCVSIALIIYKP